MRQIPFYVHEISIKIMLYFYLCIKMTLGDLQRRLASWLLNTKVKSIKLEALL